MNRLEMLPTPGPTKRAINVEIFQTNNTSIPPNPYIYPRTHQVRIDNHPPSPVIPEIGSWIPHSLCPHLPLRCRTWWKVFRKRAIILVVVVVLAPRTFTRRLKAVSHTSQQDLVNWNLRVRLFPCSRLLPRLHAILAILPILPLLFVCRRLPCGPSPDLRGFFSSLASSLAFCWLYYPYWWFVLDVWTVKGVVVCNSGVVIVIYWCELMWW